MSVTWRANVTNNVNVTNDDDDDWETDPDFVNDVTEQEQRWGSKTIQGSGRTVGAINVEKLRQDVVTEHTKVKEEFTHVSQIDGKKGFGGKFGIDKDRVDKSAVGWEYHEKIEKHASQKDYSTGFGGKFGVQKDRVDKSAVGWEHKEKLDKHASQKDYSTGFGGKFGIQKDRVDKSAVGWEYQAKLEKHESQKDYATGFGGKYGIQKDRVDKSAVGWEHHEKVEKHESQKDYSTGFGGKYGIQKDRVDKSAVGWEHHEKVEKHESQKDYSTGFGGKFGVQKDRVDKSAVGWEHHEKVEKHESQKDYKIGFGVPSSKVTEKVFIERKEETVQERRGSDIEVEQLKGKASNLRARWENMTKSGALEEENKKKVEEAKNRRLEKERKEKEEAKKSEEDRQLRMKMSNEGNKDEDDKNENKEEMEKETKRTSTSPKVNKIGISVFPTEIQSHPLKQTVQETSEKIEEKSDSSYEAKIRNERIESKVSDDGTHSTSEKIVETTKVYHYENKPQESEKEPENNWKDEEEYGDIGYNKDNQEKRGETTVYSELTEDNLEEGLKAIALFDYQAADVDEISFDPDDIITEIEMLDVGWWRGKCKDAVGLFPANYVQLLNDSKDENS